MKAKSRRRKREYTIQDLVNIAIQMNGRIRFDIIPIEMIEARKAGDKTPKPAAPQERDQ